jgi:hypothetical protein
MGYSYDRTAADDGTWHSIVSKVETDFIAGIAKALAKLVEGEEESGGFAVASVTFAGKEVRMGFKGGTNGMVYVFDPKGQRKEYSVVNHTPTTFAQLLSRSLI